MSTALIGFTGFVGTTLLKQRSFDHLYRASNIQEIQNGDFELVVCAGAPAQKWLANQQPDADRANIESLIDNLRLVKANTFVLISTVDVFPSPVGVNEESLIDDTLLEPYGKHRRLLEIFVKKNFKKILIVRLPGLVGSGLRKNIIFDFLNNNNIANIDSRSVFQFYPMINLWNDIETAMNHHLRIVHLTAEPINVEDLAMQVFGLNFINHTASHPVRYDMQSIFAPLLGGNGNYQYSKQESISAMRIYAQTEPTT